MFFRIVVGSPVWMELSTDRVSIINEAETYTSGQDRVTGMGFALLPETTKKPKEKHMEFWFARHGFQIVQDRERFLRDGEQMSRFLL